MIDAKRAKELSKMGIECNTNAMIAEIENTISEATKKGEFHMFLRYNVNFDSKKIIDTFELLGYRIIINVLHMTIEVTWE